MGIMHSSNCVTLCWWRFCICLFSCVSVFLPLFVFFCSLSLSLSFSSLLLLSPSSPSPPSPTFLSITVAWHLTHILANIVTAQVAKLQRASLQDPVKVEVSNKYQTVASLRQYYLFMPAKFKVTGTFCSYHHILNSCTVMVSLFSNTSDRACM